MLLLVSKTDWMLVSILNPYAKSLPDIPEHQKDIEKSGSQYLLKDISLTNGLTSVY